MIALHIGEIMRRLSACKHLPFVGYDWGQLDQDQPAVKWPCALVRMTEVEYSDGSLPVQQAEGTVQVTVAWVRPSKQSGSQGAYIGTTLLDVVHTLLSCDWHPKDAGYMRRVRMWRGDDTDSGIERWTIEYKVGWKEVTDGREHEVTDWEVDVVVE
ncbi:MAG: hypothetical protein IJT12_09185 [Paludibacteraceae bacterium]|nr:hypothetical protein [Paludibacteraceae bacterium]